ncbi:MAG: UDP-2,3-diacylglucosamine diphosphatase LpxI [Pseudomonadota bacterium]|nr:UDP-2,3-diacylglucosamine diphosphatase LpxI [Pseudomonadota bacterium]
MAKLGIIAGAGALPGQIISACRKAGRDYHVLAFEGSADPRFLAGTSFTWIRMSNLGAALDDARSAGVDELVFVGGIPRPSIIELMRDRRSAKFLAKVGTRILGDDNILSAVVRELEEKEGFDIVAPETILGEILASAGVYGKVAPDENDMLDIERGRRIIRELGRFDIGQAVVIQNGSVLGVEAAEGTDSLIKRCGELKQHGINSGVLVKAAKPNQSMSVDLPAVGILTVNAASKAGLRGIAVEEGRALLVERDAMIEAADLSEMFIYGLPLEA